MAMPFAKPQGIEPNGGSEKEQTHSVGWLRGAETKAAKRDSFNVAPARLETKQIFLQITKYALVIIWLFPSWGCLPPSEH